MKKGLASCIDLILIETAEYWKVDVTLLTVLSKPLVASWTAAFVLGYLGDGRTGPNGGQYWSGAARLTLSCARNKAAAGRHLKSVKGLIVTFLIMTGLMVGKSMM